MFFKKYLKKKISNTCPKITISLGYYNDKDHIQAHLDEFIKYPQNIKIQIIDDGSKVSPIINLLHDIPKKINIFRIEEDILWNIPGSRNLSATVATTPWILILDMDQIITISNLKKILELPLDNDYEFYTFNRKLGDKNKFTAGTMLVSRKLWWECGGYDEDFVGNYGYNDPFFKFKMKQIGAKEKQLKDIWCKQIQADCILSRNSMHINKKLYEEKIKSNLKTSNKTLRFSWKKIS